MNTLTVSIKDMPELLTDVFKAKRVPMVTSSPGMGKSSVYAQVAKFFNLLLIDVRLSQCDPLDLNGALDTRGDKATYKVFDTFPVEGDEVPDGYDGWMILLDEFNSAPRTVQAAAYKICLDRMVGQHKIHPKAVIGAAGNKATDKAIVNNIGTALQSRMIHLEMVTPVDAWLEYATKADYDYRIRGFINAFPDLLHKFDPNHTDHTFACHRTWEFLSDIIKPMQDIPAVKKPLIAGTVGVEAGHKFMAFLRHFQNIPKYSDILKYPDSTPIPDSKDLQHAVITSIIGNFEDADAGQVLKYVSRMAIEFQMFLLTDIVKGNRDKLKIPEIRSWVQQNAQALML